MKKPYKNKLSLCMIVKNEAHNLRDCIEPLKPVLDEIIVVDTGSIDGTKDLAKSLGAKVFDYTWCDDFSAARNESIRHATGDYILWLDGDDRMDLENINKLLKLKKQFSARKDQAYYLIIKSKEPEGERLFLQLRIFPNIKGAFFEGKIHEQIYESLIRLGVKFIKADISINHSGYEDSDLSMQKAERNLKIIEQVLKDEPNNLIIHYHAGRTLASLNRKFEAIEHMKRIVQDERAKNGDREFLLTSGILLGKYYEEVYLYQNSIDIFENLKKDFAGIGLLHFCLGMVYFLTEDYRKAKEELEKSISLPMEISLFPLNIKQIKYYQYYTLGQCYWKLGEIGLAREMLLKSLDLHKDQWRSLEVLGLMSLKDHKYEESIDYFQRAIEEGGASDKIYSNLGLAYKKIGRLWEAEAAFAKSIEMNPNRLEALINLGHLYYEKKAYEKAIECFQKALNLDSDLIDVRIVLSDIYFRQYDVDNLIAQCDALLKNLGLPRNIVIEALDDLGSLYLKIGEVLYKKGLMAISLIAYHVSFLINPTKHAFETILAIGRQTGEEEKSFQILKEVENFYKGHGKNIRFLKEISIWQ